MVEQREQDQFPPALRLHQLGVGYWVSQALYVTAKLGVADALAEGPRPAREIARDVDAHPDALHRLLRALASVDIFTEVEPGCFGLTPMGELLRGDVPGSMRALALTMELDWAAWEHLLYSVHTGRNAFERVHGEGFFAHLRRHPEKAAVFDEAMTGFVTAHGMAVAATYDFAPFGTVVDVGGGHGALMQAILSQQPHLRGVLFDQPAVIAGAEASLRRQGLDARCQCIGGDFFSAVPSGGDAYVLGSVLHDWDDEACLRILRNCRDAMPAHAKLLVIEMVIPEGDAPFFGKLLDLQMLVSFGGRERTATEYNKLLAGAGFRMLSVVQTQVPPSVIEAEPI